MGALAVQAVLIAIEVGAAAEKISATEQQEKATVAALRSRQTEERLAATQKTIARDRQMRSLIGHQIATEAASGFELSSPTFKAITEDDFNKFAEVRSNDALELDIKENQLSADINQTKSAAKAQIFGTVLSTGASIISQQGLFTNIGKSSTTQTAKLATPGALSDFNDSTATAQEQRQSGDGLFDNVGG